MSALNLTSSPRVVEVIDDGCVVGHIVAHSERQFDAFNRTGRPIGTFAALTAAESAIRGELSGEVDA